MIEKEKSGFFFFLEGPQTKGDQSSINEYCEQGERGKIFLPSTETAEKITLEVVQVIRHS